MFRHGAVHLQVSFLLCDFESPHVYALVVEQEVCSMHIPYRVGNHDL